MKIPSDVKIVVNRGDVTSECIRSIAEDDSSPFWVNGSTWLFMPELKIHSSGHFTRTVKTRRVAWDLPEGFEIPADAKAMLEKFILSISDWRDGRRAYNAPWNIHQHDGGHGRAEQVLQQFVMRFRVTESTEELPWSPFEVQK